MGASQKRSGLASAALQRLQPGAQQDATQPQGGSALRLKPTAAPQNAPAPTITPGAAAPGGQSPLAVTNIGKLRPQIGAAQGATALPFDADTADAQVSLQAQKNRFESDATADQQRIEREYLNQKRSVENELPDANRRLLENYAGRGLAYSSGYAYDQGDQQKQYADLLAQLEGGKTDGLADLLRQRGLFNDDYSTKLSQIQAAAARRLSQDAGSLGLGGEPTGGQDILDGLFGGGGAPQGPAAGDVYDAAPVQPLNPTNIMAPNLPGGVSSPYRRPGSAPSAGENYVGPTAPAPTEPLQQAAASRLSQVGYVANQPMPHDAPSTAPMIQQPAAGTRQMASFDPKSQAILSQGGTVLAGGTTPMKYDPLTGMVVRA